MKKLDGNSKDIVRQNISDLEAIFPEAVKDGQVDFNVLKNLVGRG